MSMSGPTIGLVVLRAIVHVVTGIVAIEPRSGALHLIVRRAASRATAKAAPAITEAASIRTGEGRAPIGIGRAIGAIRKPPLLIGHYRPAPFFHDVQVIRA